jgi:hypothetical protein
LYSTTTITICIWPSLASEATLQVAEKFGFT